MLTGGYWPPLSKVEIAYFGGGHSCSSWRFFGFFFSCVRGTKTFFLLLHGKILQCSPYLCMLLQIALWTSSWVENSTGSLSSSSTCTTLTLPPDCFFITYLMHRQNALSLSHLMIASICVSASLLLSSQVQAALSCKYRRWFYCPCFLWFKQWSWQVFIWASTSTSERAMGWLIPAWCAAWWRLPWFWPPPHKNLSKDLYTWQRWTHLADSGEKEMRLT